MKSLLEKLLGKLLAKPLDKLVRHIEKMGRVTASVPVATSGEEVEPEPVSEPTPASTPTAKPWRECCRSSNWDGRPSNSPPVCFGTARTFISLNCCRSR